MKIKNEPSDYYFYKADEDYYGEYSGYEDFDPPWTPEVDATVFFIVPKGFNGKFYCGCIVNEVNIPKGFGECMEGCFEIVLPIEKGRQLLLDAGFTEHHSGPPWK